MATPLQQLDAMHNVPENWDGYGGLPPQPNAIQEAKAFFASLAGIAELTSPYLSPTPNGGIQFDWDHGAHHLEVAFEPVALNGPIQVEFLYDNEQTGTVVQGKVRATGGAELPPFPLRHIVNGFASAAA